MNVVGVARIFTEPRKSLGTWLREISSCSCLTFLPGPAWVLLSKICKEFLGSVVLILKTLEGEHREWCAAPIPQNYANIHRRERWTCGGGVGGAWPLECNGRRGTGRDAPTPPAVVKTEGERGREREREGAIDEEIHFASPLKASPFVSSCFAQCSLRDSFCHPRQTISYGSWIGG